MRYLEKEIEILKENKRNSNLGSEKLNKANKLWKELLRSISFLDRITEKRSISFLDRMSGTEDKVETLLH